jgi:hypothetical protein
MTTLNDGGASGSGWRRGVGPTNSTIPGKLRGSGGAASFAVALAVLAIFTGPSASAGPGNPNPPPPDPPSDSDVIRPLGVITPTASNWQPKFPFPYDQTRNQVTDADITSMREMCQWYNADYPTLSAQIDRLQFNRIGPDGNDYDYGRDDIQQQVDIVTGNIAQAVDFMTPRAQALTQAQNPFGDNYFPIYKGEAFYKLWEQLFNVNNGILAHQPDWFTGPSVQKAKRWGSDIHRSHVCD